MQFVKKNFLMHLGEFDMKLCIVGNSHVGALKRAWESMPERHKLFSIAFFADRGEGLKELDVSDDRLVPKTDRLKSSLEFTSGGRSAIAPKEYDYILIYGAGAKPLFVDSSRGYSSAVLKQAASDHVVGSLSFELIKKIKGISDKKILVGHNPLPARKREVEAMEPKEYFYGIELLNKFVYSKFDSHLLPQPSRTIVNGRYTAPSFSKGSKRLSVGDHRDNESHPDRDSSHMNDDFGIIWLSDFLDYIYEV